MSRNKVQSAKFVHIYTKAELKEKENKTLYDTEPSETN